MRQQVHTETATASSIMRSAAFVRGFKEVRKGIPMDYDAFSDPRDRQNRWNYERGRLFGCIYSQALKDGARLKGDAVWAFTLAYAKRWVC